MKPESQLRNKIAVEEHFVPSGLESCISAAGWTEEKWMEIVARAVDVDGRRLEHMDTYGIERVVLSLASNGIQGIEDPDEATRVARMANDALAEVIAAHPDRYSGFGAVALQDPSVAAAEAVRAVRELGLKGVLVNGYSDLPQSCVRYYDDPACIPFWEAIDELSVPVYLHPRNPPKDQRRIYEGREELLGAPWAFAVETATHALRLITSGLFDRFPELTLILGHLGEQLPFALGRMDARIVNKRTYKLARSPREVFRENFFVSTSGNAHTPSLLGLMLELGADRIMFALDYPFEEMAEVSEWFDDLPISEADRHKIGRGNASRLFGLG